MSNVRKAWNGGSKEAAMEEARKRQEEWDEAKRLKAHKIMTPEEYAALPLQGWHMVCKDIDGFGGIGVRYLGDAQ
jgi:hypothetical protein